MERDEKRTSMSCSWCGACGQLHDRRKPNRLLSLQFGDAGNEQVVVPAFGAPDGECDNMIGALTPVTNSVKR